jgi:hypothetical protein
MDKRNPVLAGSLDRTRLQIDSEHDESDREGMQFRGRPRGEAPKGYATVSESAETLAVTHETIRNRVRRGSLRGKRIKLPSGEYRYYVEQRALITEPVVDEVTMQRQDMDYETFRRLVADDSRDQVSEAERAFLRAEPNLQRWSDALHEINKDLEAQFMERKADAQVVQNECFAAGPEGKRRWFEYKAQYDHWRAGARRFHKGIQMRIKENKALMRDLSDANEVKRLRWVLEEVMDFLNEEEATTYRFVPERDRLKDKVRRTLYGGE